MAEDAKLDDLLRAAVGGDRAALVALLQELSPPIRARIEGKIPAAMRPMLDADDVMQVTYSEAFLRLKRFTTGGAGAFAAWLGRLAENNLIDAVRAMEAAKRPDPRKRVGGGADSEASMVQLVELLGVTNTTPSRVMAKGEASGALLRAIDSLPEQYAKVVRLYDLAGKSVREVAAELGKSDGAIFMLRARAHERLRELMGPRAQFFSQSE